MVFLPSSEFLLKTAENAGTVATTGCNHPHSYKYDDNEQYDNAHHCPYPEQPPALLLDLALGHIAAAAYTLRPSIALIAEWGLIRLDHEQHHT